MRLAIGRLALRPYFGSAARFYDQLCEQFHGFINGQEIGNLNGISSDVVDALNAIKNAIQNVSEYVSSTAAAVEEQSTVTGEMSSSMRRAAEEAASIGEAA